MARPHLLITAADAQFFDLARGCIESVRDKATPPELEIAFLDLGCLDGQLAWLRNNVDHIRQPEWEFTFPGRDEAPGYMRGLLARPFMPRYFPGHDIYVWLDTDAWVQDWRAIELFIDGARRRRGLAIVPQIDRGSRTQYGGLPVCWKQTYEWYSVFFGREAAERFHTYPMLNAGVFAMHRDAPHWKLWGECLGSALRRAYSTITDQIALNFTVYAKGTFARTEMLPAWCNWTCHDGMPCWDEERACLAEPYLPHTPIGVMHLTVTKLEHAHLTTTRGAKCWVSVQYPARVVQGPPPSAPDRRASTVVDTAGSTEPSSGQLERAAAPIDRDYVSPGLTSVAPDRHFPNMVAGNKSASPWPYLRREIPHTWYVDQRSPQIGFLSRDEAQILYNAALEFRRKRALEIGCWMGWSTCHLALGGVRLDVIDPVLQQAGARASVVESLTAAGVIDSVELLGGASPEQVHVHAAARDAKWSLIFIDGDHDAPHPLADARACAGYAADDAMILFHDLVSPAVAEGFDHFRRAGWRTMVYQTMQIMGVAWRGDVQPVAHFPDPSVSWSLPGHLRHHPVCGWNERYDCDQSRAEFQELLTRIRSYTLLSEQRLTSLYTLAKHICLEDLPGNFVECGTYRGGAAGLMAYVIKNYSRRDRRLYCFDTFEGMPDPKAVDRHRGTPANDVGFGAGTLKAPIAENLHVLCRELDVADVVEPIKGLFAHTLPESKAAVGPIALLHADGDWYDSTMDILDNLYDRVVDGGYIQIDDFGFWEGCRKAVHDFQSRRGLSFTLHEIDDTGVWLRPGDSAGS